MSAACWRRSTPRAVRLPDERVDGNEVAAIVQAAVEVRNGWKVILGRCATKPSTGTAMQK